MSDEENLDAGTDEVPSEHTEPGTEPGADASDAPADASDAPADASGDAPPERGPPEPPQGTHVVPPHFSSGKASRLPKEKLMVTEGIIPIQAGTNKFDSQKGMTGFGTARDVLDHSKCTVLKELDEKQLSACKEVLRLQSGSNKFASQKGHSAFGAVRDVNNHVVQSSTMTELPEETVRMSEGIVRLQSGTNKLASQAGYTAFGAIRGVKPARFDNPEQDPESQGFIHLQMGTNKFASQSGMTGMGMPRNTVTNIVDTERDEITNDESVLPRQTIGSAHGANQSGMTGFGAFRNTTVFGIRNQDRKSQGLVPYQMGINWMDSQAGKTAFGQPRLTLTPYVDDTRPELPDELARNPNTPQWNKGSHGCASQAGMTGMGMPRDVKGHYLRRLW